MQTRKTAPSANANLKPNCETSNIGSSFGKDGLPKPVLSCQYLNFAKIPDIK